MAETESNTEHGETVYRITDETETEKPDAFSGGLNLVSALNPGDGFEIRTENGEWHDCLYVGDWGSVTPWGRTPDDKYKVMFSWYRVLVNDDSGVWKEARVYRDIPQKRIGIDVMDIDVETHYNGGFDIAPWGEHTQGGLGVPDDQELSASADAIYLKEPARELEKHRQGYVGDWLVECKQCSHKQAVTDADEEKRTCPECGELYWLVDGEYSKQEKETQGDN